MTNLLIFLLGVWLVGCGACGLINGNVLNGGRNNPGNYINRQTEPVHFWLTVIAYLGFGVALLWVPFK